MALIPESVPAGALAGCRSVLVEALPLQSSACRTTASPQHVYPACCPPAIPLARDVGPRSTATYRVCAAAPATNVIVAIVVHNVILFNIVLLFAQIWPARVLLFGSSDGRFF